MIVQTMTDDEITTQMEMDLPEVRAKAMYREKEFRRLIIKSTSFPVVAAPFVVTTANRNPWIVIFRAMKRCERKNISLDHTTFVCTANFADGIWAFLMTSALSQGKKRIGLALFKSHDRDKILATVAATVLVFTDHFPDVMVYAQGSTPARTRL